jgi:mRNA interferase MazF
MVEKRYIPEKGDIVLLSFSPTTGHEQKGKRPAIVVSSFLYNDKSGLALMCPITNQKKGYPFEVELKKCKTKGVILSDQIRTLDYKERKVQFLEKTTPEIILKVIKNISLLIKE